MLSEGVSDQGATVSTKADLDFDLQDEESIFSRKLGGKSEMFSRKYSKSFFVGFSASASDAF